MPYGRRTKYLAFLENQKRIEASWDKRFGDRKNEIVFIGQEMDEELIRSGLDACLATPKELTSKKWKKGYKDEWPIERIYEMK